MIVEGNKFIHFELAEDGKTWNVINKSGGYSLCQISYFGGWRQYVICPAANMVFNNTCLVTIINFLIRLNKEKRI